MTDQTTPIRRALLSVSDKSGIVDFARTLASRGVEILSTGGTARALKEAGVDVVDVAAVTGSPEMLDGRVKTLHPKVHGGLLADRTKSEHMAALSEHGIPEIDLLAINLYPFETTLAGGADFAACIENIDIGGPAMIRAAAKNHASVTVLVDPDDYVAVLDELDEGGVTAETRRRMAAKAFSRTAAYDAAISRWFTEAVEDPAPVWTSFGGTLAQSLRYGENPHQEASFYKMPEARSGPARPGVATAEQVQGKALSYNNINDTDAAFELVAEFDAQEAPAVAIIKHANPCGVAIGGSLREAYEEALRCDPVSAFGGIVAFNRALDAEAAEKVVEIFTEVIVAPAASPEAIAIVAAKKTLRLLVTGGLPDPAAPGRIVKSVAGGLLVQSRDNGRLSPKDLKVVTKRAPSAREMADLVFAWRVAKHVKSNAIVYAKDGATTGIGAGQMSRIDSARIAARKSAAAAEAAGLPEPLAR